MVCGIVNQYVICSHWSKVPVVMTSGPLFLPTAVGSSDFSDEEVNQALKAWLHGWLHGCWWLFWFEDVFFFFTGIRSHGIHHHFSPLPRICLELFFQASKSRKSKMGVDGIVYSSHNFLHMGILINPTPSWATKPARHHWQALGGGPIKWDSAEIENHMKSWNSNGFKLMATIYTWRIIPGLVSG